jgi:hypothetical protein
MFDNWFTVAFLFIKDHYQDQINKSMHLCPIDTQQLCNLTYAVVMLLQIGEILTFMLNKGSAKLCGVRYSTESDISMATVASVVALWVWTLNPIPDIPGDLMTPAPLEYICGSVDTLHSVERAVAVAGASSNAIKRHVNIIISTNISISISIRLFRCQWAGLLDAVQAAAILLNTATSNMLWGRYHLIASPLSSTLSLHIDLESLADNA